MLNMNTSEKKAQLYLRGRYPLGFIRKIPDFKQCGSLVGGLPDYLIIDNCDTLWYEIKYVSQKRKSISIDDFTQQQLIVFTKMLEAGAKIYVLVYFGADKLRIVSCDSLFVLFKKCKSINKDALEAISW